MRIKLIKCSQVYKSAADTLSVTVTSSSVKDGIKIELSTDGYSHTVCLHDISINDFIQNWGILSGIFEKCSSDMKDKFTDMRKVSENYTIQYVPVTINNQRSSFCIEATEIRKGYSEVDVYVDTRSGRSYVDFGHIPAQDLNELLEKCERYCSGMYEIADILVGE